MKNAITLSLRVFIGLVFLLSAYSKLIAPGIIEIILIDHGIVHNRDTAAVFVHLLISFELALGLMFFQPFSIKKIVIPASFTFLSVFTIYLFYTGFILKDNQNCGCFGEMIKMAPLASIIKNCVLIGLLVVLYKIIDDRKNYWIPVILLVFSIAVVFIALPVNTHNDLKFSKYTNFEDRGRVDLSSGNKLIVILNLECDHCQNLVKELTALEKGSSSFPETYALLFREGNISIEEFKKMTGFNFPYIMIGASEFFDLIGQSPPRIYWQLDGKQKEVWDKDISENIKKNFSLK